MNKDLTVGNPSTVLWKFCLPMFGSVVFQQLYNIADSLVAGKFVGEAALAAVGNSYEITLIFIAFAFGCNIGCSVIVSRFFGAKQYRDMKTAVTTSLIGCAALVALLMLVGLAGCSADCGTMWQIGIDVLPAYRRRGIAAALTSRLALEILRRDRIPFYCAAWSNLKSVRNALRSGFRPAWVEMTAKSLAFVQNMNA